MTLNQRSTVVFDPRHEAPEPDSLRWPFETPAHTDELFESNSRREAETRLLFGVVV